MSGLEPHTLYALRVRALNSVGASVSEAQRFRTAPAPPHFALSRTAALAQACARRSVKPLILFVQAQQGL